MLYDYAMDGRSQGHFFLGPPSSPKISVKTGPTYLGQWAHSLDTQAALQRHPGSYFVVDALSPEVGLCRRRAPTLCQACLKKSTSSVLFASTRFSLVICLRRISSRDRVWGGSISSNRSRQL